MNRILPTIVCSVTLAVLLVVAGAQTQAAPFTDHFDMLIADLQSRAATLSNSTDTVERKQFRATQRVLGLLEGKPSLSLATDINRLGRIANMLVRAFPDDFSPTPGTFSTDLETALQGLVGDVQAIMDSTQTTLDGLGVSTCTTRAQNKLAIAQDLVSQATSAPDFATAAKLLRSGLKFAQRVSAITIRCSSVIIGGGHGDYMRATIRGDFNADFSSLVAAASGSGSFLLMAGGDDALGGVGIAITVFSVTGPGTYPVGVGTNVSRLTPHTTYYATSGTITFTTFDPANKKIAGSFSFAASQQVGTGTISVSNGTFNFTDFGAD